MLKNRLILAVAVLVAILITPALGQGADGVSLRVEKGDTLINLFGADWQKAYRQNTTVVLRNGEPLSSPDILVEGAVIYVSSDTLLTSRAVARVAGLEQRRAELQRHLAALESRATSRPEIAASVAACQRRLSVTEFYAADIEYVEKEVGAIENAAALQPQVTGSPTHGLGLLAILLGLALLLVAASVTALVSRGEGRSMYGSDRYDGADEGLQTLMNGLHRDQP